MVQDEPAATPVLEQASVVIPNGAPIDAVPMFNVSVPELVTTTGWLGEDVDTRWVPKVRLDADSDTAGCTPLPVTVTACGELSASSLKESVACSGPKVVGANRTCTVQVLPTVSVPLEHVSGSWL